MKHELSIIDKIVQKINPPFQFAQLYWSVVYSIVFAMNKGNLNMAHHRS